ncbi:unnamed protein product [Effrenium voratum]|nr:unnamed protein product [Effrenium voratum]
MRLATLPRISMPRDPRACCTGSPPRRLRKALAQGRASFALAVSLARRFPKSRAGRRRSAVASEKASEEKEESWHRIYAPPVRLKDHRSHRFAVDDPDGLKHLRDEGYVVFREALGPEEVEHATDLFWKYMGLSTQGKVCREDPLSWQSPNWPGQCYNGLINSGGVGQSEFMWYVRTRQRVLEAFASLWQVEPADLLASFDGCCAFRPDARSRTRGGWFHTDQNGLTTGSDFACAQGLVSLTHSDACTGGFAVIPRSHKHHAKIFERWPLERENDFFVLPRSDEMLKAPWEPHLVQMRAGDLVLWDSRLIHCNVPAWHRFDEAPLSEALKSAGLEKAQQALLPELTSVADAAWTFAAHEANLEELFASWGLAPPLLPQVAQQLRAWAEQVAEEQAALAPPHRLSRLAAYVCFAPRPAPEDRGAMRMRLAAALLGATTSHWPTRCVVSDTALSREGLANFKDLDGVALRLLGCEAKDAATARGELRTVLRTLLQRCDGAHLQQLAAIEAEL